MANRTYLIQSASAAPADYDPDKDILAASNYSIPVFWYALFDGSSIVTKPAQMEDGTSVLYPFLVTSTAAAKTRFVERGPFLQALLPQTVASTFDDFARLLETVETAHIHLETVELWMMDEPEKFQPHVEACLRAFDLPKRGVAPSTLPSTPEWRELLSQVEIDAGDIAGSTEPYMLTGSSWVRPVTWKE
ncbi:MAG TPA: hypothetical protein VNT99_07830 [Methylomirabilota bacterium]|nr:hypothetical protein [Methylomirabilota bacterium]